MEALKSYNVFVFRVNLIANAVPPVANSNDIFNATLVDIIMMSFLSYSDSATCKTVPISPKTSMISSDKILSPLLTLIKLAGFEKYIAEMEANFTFAAAGIFDTNVFAAFIATYNRR